MCQRVPFPTSLKLCNLEENILVLMQALCLRAVSFVSEKSSFPLISVKIYSDLHKLQTFEALKC